MSGHGGQAIEGTAVQVVKTEGVGDPLGDGALTGGGGAIDGEDGGQRERGGHVGNKTD